MADTSQSYSALTNEYYDEIRHPTCANFRSASAIILRRYLPSLLGGKVRACELGAGRSLLAEICEEMGRHEVLAGLVISDASPEMLSHSRRWKEYGSVLTWAEASALPYPDEYFNLVVAILCDPYNEQKTWREVSRILHPHGHCIVTVPSHEWAVTYRELTHSNTMSAEFELRSGAKISVPSFIFPPEEQKERMGEAGLFASSYDVVRRSEIKGQPISPKLLVDGDDLPILEAYVLSKGRALNI